MNRSRTLRTTLLALVAAAALPFASCGGGSDGGNPSGGGGGGGAADVVITIVAENGNMSYSPNPANVTRGQSVAWRNSAATIHTATQNGGAFNTGNISSGNTSGGITMSTAGTFDYHCALHPAMVGTLNVQ